MSSYFIVHPSSSLSGETKVPGDKSISHRSVLFASLAQGKTTIDNWLAAGDTEATLAAMKQLGIAIKREGLHHLEIEGGKLQASSDSINLRHAGTGMRLLAGILAGQDFPSVLDGSEQLRKRPMKRIIDPLLLMGAKIESPEQKAPLHISPSSLQGISYTLPMASAQVKSAVLLAGLFAQGVTEVIEPGPSRDHTENMLKAMGANIEVTGNHVRLTPGQPLQAIDIKVPGDISSAAFIIVAALITPESDVTIHQVNVNPRRTGILDVLLQMGANIKLTPSEEQAGEPTADIRVRSSSLQGVAIKGDIVVRMIDEFPILMVAALHTNGVTTLEGAKELRVKETDRLAVMTSELKKMGVKITETPDGFSIPGNQKLLGAKVDGHDDHRIAMSLAVAGLVACGQTLIEQASCSADSFPDYAKTMTKLKAEIGECKK